MIDKRSDPIPGMRPPHWWFAGIFAVMLLDMASPSWWGICVLHLALMPLAWRFLHRRFVIKVTVLQLAAVAIAGTWHAIFGQLGREWGTGEIGSAATSLLANKGGESVSPMPFNLVRLWTLLAIVAAGYFHDYFRRRLRKRLGQQHFLQQNIRRRSRELERVNHALRDEVARRQATQHRLDQSETTFQSIMDRMNLQVARKNAEGVFTYANQPFCKGLGREPIDVIGSTDADLYKPAVSAKYRADDLKVITTGQNIDKVEEHPGVDGQPGFVQVFKAPEYDQHGRCIGIQVIFWDITAKHRSEIALRHSEARKRALFDAAGDAVLLIDDAGMIMEANPSATELLHAGSGRLVGRPLEHLVIPVQTTAPEEALDSNKSAGDTGLTASSRKPVGFQSWLTLPLSERHQVRLRRGDGVAFDSEVSVHTIPLGNQAITGRNSQEREGLAVIIRDVTLQQQAFEAMRDAKAAAEQANRTKTQFMAGISHELRTPLGGIRGLTELLSQQTLSAPARRYVNLISQNTELLHDAIEDILDFSAIEAGRVAIAPAATDLHAVVGDAIGCLAIRVANKPVRLSLSIAPGVPRHVHADAKRIRQIIVNLVGNAIKFTPSGQVSLRLTTVQHRMPMTDQKRISMEPAPIQDSDITPVPISETEVAADVSKQAFQLIVEDTGIGIAPENQSRIFDAFEQADRGTNKQFGGTGLGLAIARGLAQRMGGGIRLESTVGQGSRFVVDFSLPVVAGVDPNAQLTKAITQQQRKSPVALSVDNPLIEEALVETIIPMGFQTFRPSTLPSNLGKVPMLWILTSSMADAAFRVRARKSQDRILWLTRAGETAPRRAKKEDAVMIEPVLPDELRRWLAGLPLRQSSRGLPENGSPSSGPARSTVFPGSQNNRFAADNVSASHALSNVANSLSDGTPSVSGDGTLCSNRVLVVDDSPTNRLVIHDQLVASGHIVQTAEDGPVALKLYQRHLNGDHRFDCILMDLQMPKMDGTEVAREIFRLSQQGNQVPPPIIALTAHVTDQHRQMCRDAGMVGYVTKPIHLGPLLEEMQRVIAISPASSPPDSPLPTSEDSVPAKKIAERIDAPAATTDIVEDAWRSRLATHCGNEESTMNSVCEAIVMEIPDLVRRLESAGKSGNQRTFTTAAHTLKSCLRYVADSDDSRLASEVEKNSSDANWISNLKVAMQTNKESPELAQLRELQGRAKAWVKRIKEYLKSN